MPKMSKGEKSVGFYEMSDSLYENVNNYLLINDISFAEFCSKVRIDKYMLGKIMDRKIKMRAYRSLLRKVADYIGMEQSEFQEIQPKDAL